MVVPYIQERQELLRLHKMEDALREKMEEELAPLALVLRTVSDQAEREFQVAGGLTMGQVFAGKPLDRATQDRLLQERSDKEAPATEAYQAARQVHEKRIGDVRGQRKALETRLGDELAENWWAGRDSSEHPVFCAISGQPILANDTVVHVIAQALPDAAHN